MPELTEQVRAHAVWIDERAPDFEPAAIRGRAVVDVDVDGLGPIGRRSPRRVVVLVAAAVLVALVAAAAIVHARGHGNGVTTVNRPGAGWVEAPDLTIPTAQGWIGTRVQPIWTGHEVLLVGELTSAFQGLDPKNGAPKISTLLGIPAYDPATRRWHILPRPPVDLYSTDFSAVWAGDRLIVIGPTQTTSGPDGIGAGAAYDPATDRWTTIAAPSLGHSLDGVAVWTGHEVLTWTAGVGVSAYSPSQDRWRDLTHEARVAGVTVVAPRVSGEPPLANQPEAAWTGHEMVVAGDVYPAVSAFDPTTSAWRDLPVPPVSIGGQPLTWTGRYLASGDPSFQVTWYDSATGQWQSQAGPPSFHDRVPFGGSAWIGDRYVALGGGVRHGSSLGTAATSTPDPTGASFDPATGAWRAIPPLPDGAISITHAVAAGDALFAWGEDQPTTLVAQRTIRAATLAAGALDEPNGSVLDTAPPGTASDPGRLGAPAALRDRVTCQADGTYRITWSLRNLAHGPGSALTIRSASTEPFGAVPATVSFDPTELEPGQTATASAVVAGTQGAKLVLRVTFGLARRRRGLRRGGRDDADGILPATLTKARRSAASHHNGGMTDIGSVGPAPPDAPSADDPLAGGALRVRLLGEFQLEGIDLRGLRSRKARTMLKVLALGRGRAVTVDRLIEGMWPDAPPPQPERELAVNVSRARKVIGRDRIERSDAGYRLAVDWLDLDVVDQLVAEARRRSSAGDPVAARTAAAGALALVRGPLLADEPDADWLGPDRLGLDRTVAELRDLAARAALTVGELGEAAALAEHSIATDPYDEAAVRVLMTARARAGRPGSALAAYAAMRERLTEDLGASPTAETEAVHTAILRDELEPRPASPTTDDGVTRPPGPGAGTLDTTGARPVHVPGREPVLDELADALAASRHGLELVVLEGEAGSGKSHVLDAFAERARQSGAQVLIGPTDELGRALPLQPIADALALYLHTSGESTRDDALRDDIELLGPLLGLGGRERLPIVPGPTMTGEAMQSAVFSALLRSLGRIAATQPTVLLLDDLHLAGPAIIEWLRFATRRRFELPLLVVAARRPDEGLAFTGTRAIELGPLELDAAREIVGSERAELLYERSGGNALLLVELAADEAGLLPGTVRESVARRLERAGPDVVATLRTAAVLGPEIDLDLLAEVSGRPPLDLLLDLEDGVRRRFLVERGSRFAFRHALVREAVVAETSAARQTLMHRAAARALAGRPESDPLELAYHARLGGDLEIAARALAQAADLSTGRHDLAEAENLLTEALDLSDDGDLHLARGHIRVARTNFDGGEVDAEAAIALGRRAEGLALRSWIARHRHDFTAAIRLGLEGAGQAHDPTTKASCLLAVGLCERGLGHLPAAEARITEAIAQRAPDDLGLPGWLGVLRVYQGRVDEALDLLEPALGAEIDAVQGFWVEHVTQMTAHAHALQGRPDRALAALDRLSREMDRRGSRTRYRGLDDNYRSWIIRSLGAPDAAADLNRSVLDQPIMPEARAQALLDLASSHLMEKEWDSVADRIAQSRAVSSQTFFNNQWRAANRADLVEALAALELRDVGSALTIGTALRDRSEAQGERRHAVLARLIVARAHHLDGSAVDRAALAADLDQLPALAGLEAWWITAAVAAEFGEDRWRALAEERVGALAAYAGDQTSSFVAYATARFEALGLR